MRIDPNTIYSNTVSPASPYPSPQVLDSWSSIDAQGNDGIEASAVPAVSLLGAVERDADAQDPTGQPTE